MAKLIKILTFAVFLSSKVIIMHAHFAHGVPRFNDPDEDTHNHQTPTKPCDACPRNGQCVPKVQCPAHVRPGSYNPLCHIEGQPGMVGVCCFTGSKHAAELDSQARSTSSISSEDLKKSHALSKMKLDNWLKRAEDLKANPDAVVNETSPSFGHHLSVSTDPEADQLGHGALMNLFAVQDLKVRDVISDEEVHLRFTEHADGPFCPPQPRCPGSNRYRSIGGHCNNPMSPSWGATRTGFERLLPPNFSDGLWSFRTSVTGAPLPSARAISTTLLLPSSVPSNSHNLMFMQFGQFLVHDMSAAVVFTLGNSSAISCCVGDGEDFQPEEFKHWACAAIPIPNTDNFYQPYGHKCHNFVRAQLAPASDCSAGYANPMNGVTHFVDLSQLYGSTDEKASKLRSAGGLLNTFEDYGRELPPLTEKKECLMEHKGSACYESGDNHGNQVISLTVFHTIWTREHNRLARTLTALNPEWDEERVFFEARRIQQAVFQNIVYNEWLPLLLGQQHLQAFGLNPSVGYSSAYNPKVDPSLTVEFSAAAMRFGHSTVDSKLLIPDINTNSVYETISLPEVMFQPSRMRLRLFMDRLIQGLVDQPMQNVDPLVSETLTRYLFHGGNPYGLDLAAINIQRGRDFGIRSYNDYRRLCGLEPYSSFDQFPPSAAQRLSSVYESPEDIDLWIGGLLEESAEGSLVGPTFLSIIADQFSRSKRGDRYYFEYGPQVNPGAFSIGQLAEIKKVTLSRLICDNRDGFELKTMPPRAFLRTDLPGNAPVPCDSPLIPSMDLNRFREF